MAQWCKWEISNTRWDWRILKPGTYGADCIDTFLQSNDAINLVYDGFNHLYRSEGQNTDRWIETWYALVRYDPASGVIPGIPDHPTKAGTSSRWVSASEMNKTYPLNDSNLLHDGVHFKLFNMIEVSNCNSAGEYENKGTITIKLTNLKPWVDGYDSDNDTYFWVNPQPGFDS